LSTVRVACCQLATDVEDPHRSAARTRAAIAEAIAGGAEMLRPLLRQLVDKAYAATLAGESGAGRPAAVLAARKAFVMNVIGDVGMVFAAFVIFLNLNVLDFSSVFSRVHQLPKGGTVITAICLLLLVGAVAKSAQLPLHTWLPDAMEGPTPVSALIHAATMVTAGVYLVVRAHPIYDHAPAAAMAVAVVGCASAVFAATVGMAQYDIKRVLAYSTMSQIGYMVLAVGVGAYAAGTFHFVTHAFFKALLFMAAGIIIHDLGGEQDIRKMGGLVRRMPLAFWTFLVGTLAIVGIFPFAGFFSKDAILDQLLALHHPILWAFATATALITAYYMFRLLFMTFFTGEYRGDHEPHTGTARTMVVPTVILAGLATVGGWLVLPGRDEISRALQGAFTDRGPLPAIGEINWFVSGVTTLAALAGIAGAYWLYQRAPDLRARLGSAFAPVHRLLANAYYVDTIYHWIVEVPVLTFASDVAKYIDPEGVGGFTAGIAHATSGIGEAMRGWETGYLRRYGLTMVIGMVLVLAYYLFVVHAGTSIGMR